MTGSYTGRYHHHSSSNHFNTSASGNPTSVKTTDSSDLLEGGIEESSSDSGVSLGLDAGHTGVMGGPRGGGRGGESLKNHVLENRDEEGQGDSHHNTFLPSSTTETYSEEEESRGGKKTRQLGQDAWIGHDRHSTHPQGEEEDQSGRNTSTISSSDGISSDLPTTAISTATPSPPPSSNNSTRMAPHPPSSSMKLLSTQPTTTPAGPSTSCHTDRSWASVAIGKGGGGKRGGGGGTTPQGGGVNPGGLASASGGGINMTTSSSSSSPSLSTRPQHQWFSGVGVQGSSLSSSAAFPDLSYAKKTAVTKSSSSPSQQQLQKSHSSCTSAQSSPCQKTSSQPRRCSFGGGREEGREGKGMPSGLSFSAISETEEMTSGRGGDTERSGGGGSRGNFLAGGSHSGSSSRGSEWPLNRNKNGARGDEQSDDLRPHHLSNEQRGHQREKKGVEKDRDSGVSCVLSMAAATAEEDKHQRVDDDCVAVGGEGLAFSSSSSASKTPLTLPSLQTSSKKSQVPSSSSQPARGLNEKEGQEEEDGVYRDRDKQTPSSLSSYLSVLAGMKSKSSSPPHVVVSQRERQGVIAAGEGDALFSSASGSLRAKELGETRRSSSMSSLPDTERGVRHSSSGECFYKDQGRMKSLEDCSSRGMVTEETRRGEGRRRGEGAVLKEESCLTKKTSVEISTRQGEEKRGHEGEDPLFIQKRMKEEEGINKTPPRREDVKRQGERGEGRGGEGKSLVSSSSSRISRGKGERSEEQHEEEEEGRGRPIFPSSSSYVQHSHKQGGEGLVRKEKEKEKFSFREERDRYHDYPLVSSQLSGETGCQEGRQNLKEETASKMNYHPLGEGAEKSLSCASSLSPSLHESRSSSFVEASLEPNLSTQKRSSGLPRESSSSSLSSSSLRKSVDGTCLASTRGRSYLADLQSGVQTGGSPNMTREPPISQLITYSQPSSPRGGLIETASPPSPRGGDFEADDEDDRKRKNPFMFPDDHRDEEDRGLKADRRLVCKRGDSGVTGGGGGEDGEESFTSAYSSFSSSLSSRSSSSSHNCVPPVCSAGNGYRFSSPSPLTYGRGGGSLEEGGGGGRLLCRPRDHRFSSSTLVKETGEERIETGHPQRRHSYVSSFSSYDHHHHNNNSNHTNSYTPRLRHPPLHSGHLHLPHDSSHSGDSSHPGAEDRKHSAPPH
ncbi:hypothetical protein CSUI_011299, partial [Cystoisospora suis]